MLEATRWEDIEWKKIQSSVQQKQNMMYQASGQSDWKRVRQLQRDIIRDKYAKLLAVRKVTVENTGKFTAGIDGETIRDNQARWNLAIKLKLDDKYEPKPTKRIYIPKSNGKKRPLGIPTVKDRAMQALVKMALEPEWEAKFSADSYGFRPGRSAHDAVRAVWNSLKLKKYAVILDADIKGCFDNLNQEHILKRLDGVSSNIKRAINKWFKCGYIEEGLLHPTKEGTPQGGVISPLLANIGLWGIDFELHHELMNRYGVKRGLFKASSCYASNLKRRVQTHSPPMKLIRYADDFVIVCPDQQMCEEIENILPGILAKRGLSLNLEKTKRVMFFEGEKFSFLGFEFNRWKTGKHDKTYKVTFYAEPSKVYEFNRKLREWTKNIRFLEKTETVEQKADYLRKMLNGWLNYYKWSIDASHSFKKLRRLLHETLYKSYEDIHRHRATREGFKTKYIVSSERMGHTKDRYKFGRVEFEVFDISTNVRWNKVQGARSPYDGDTEYWANRNAILTGTMAEKLYKRQRGICPICGKSLEWETQWNRHHIDRNRFNNQLKNLQLIHQDCHRLLHQTIS